jgi:hypothetical protein
MARIGLISCVSKKRFKASRAEDLYDSALFLKSREFVKQRCDKWLILSAKYGLVDPDQIIEPYEDTLNTKSVAKRLEWANRVWQELQSHVAQGDDIIILAGERYREQLVPRLEASGCAVHVPLKGLGIGKQLQWLSERLSHPTREQDIHRFYEGLAKLERGVGERRLMGDCTAQKGWPKSGVYFLFEPGEHRLGSTESRVVRIGTHGVSRGSKATLWNRLRTHRGTTNGVGNHRSSIFRLHVGAAMAVREPTLVVDSWGVGQNTLLYMREAEARLERNVSAHIGSMHVLWLAIEDEPSPSSDRAYIERNLIGLLVGRSGPVDAPSEGWLGMSSPHHRIRKSGLWNLDFIDYAYSPECLDVFEQYVDVTIGKIDAPTTSIAPRNWYANERLIIPRCHCLENDTCLS